MKLESDILTVGKKPGLGDVCIIQPGDRKQDLFVCNVTALRRGGIVFKSIQGIYDQQEVILASPKNLEAIDIDDDTVKSILNGHYNLPLRIKYQDNFEIFLGRK